MNAMTLGVEKILSLNNKYMDLFTTHTEIEVEEDLKIGLTVNSVEN